MAMKASTDANAWSKQAAASGSRRRNSIEAEPVAPSTVVSVEVARGAPTSQARIARPRNSSAGPDTQNGAAKPPSWKRLPPTSGPSVMPTPRAASDQPIALPTCASGTLRIKSEPAVCSVRPAATPWTERSAMQYAVNEAALVSRSASANNTHAAACRSMAEASSSPCEPARRAKRGAKGVVTRAASWDCAKRAPTHTSDSACAFATAGKNGTSV
eukprot:5868803-Prymnesium_polylepis.1